MFQDGRIDDHEQDAVIESLNAWLSYTKNHNKADISRELCSLLGKSYSRNLLSKILEGELNFRNNPKIRSSIIELAWERIVRPKLDSNSCIHFNKSELIKYICREIREGLNFHLSPVRNSEQNDFSDLLNRLKSSSKALGKARKHLDTILLDDFSFQQVSDFRNFKNNHAKVIDFIKSQPINLTFASSQTAIAALFLYIQSQDDINWLIDTDITHSVYLERTIRHGRKQPNIVILSDSLALDYFIDCIQNTYKFLCFTVPNNIVILTNKRTEVIDFKPLSGDFFTNTSYKSSGGLLLFDKMKDSRLIRSTIVPRHNWYESNIGCLNDKNNFVITNDSQSRLYSLRESIKTIYEPMRIDNLVLYDSDYFSKFTNGNLLLKAIKYLMFENTIQLRTLLNEELEAFVSKYILGNEAFIKRYMESKSIIVE